MTKTTAENVVDVLESVAEPQVPVKAPPAAAGEEAGLKDLISERIQFLERQIQSSEQRTRDVAKQHKKRLRDVQKLVADKTRPADAIIEELQQRTLTALADAWRLQKRVPDLEAEVATLTRQLQTQGSDLQRVEAVRDKLQSLCRELQQQNKQIVKDAGELQAREAASRQEMIASFNASVNGVSERLNEQAEVIATRTTENEALRAQLTTSMEAISKSEAHLEHQQKVFDLEKKLLETKLQQQEELRERATERAELLAAHCKGVLEENEALRADAAQRAAALEEHQATLRQTSDVFAMLRSEQKTLHARVKDLEGSHAAVKQQYDRAAQMLLEKTGECATLKASNAKLGLANNRLQAVCRALQSAKRAGDGGGDGGGG